MEYRLKQMGWLIPVLNALPDWFVKMTSKPTEYLREQHNEYAAQIKRILGEGTDAKNGSAHPTIFHALRDDPGLPAQEKSVLRLRAEAMSLVGAGTLTTGHALSTLSYHILANRPVFDKLMTELETAIPDLSVPVSLESLETLPYLSGVINEALRISHGTMHRLTRIHKVSSLTFNEWNIPPNTPVAMTPAILQNDEEMFPDHLKFSPERWIEAEKETRDAMAKCLFSFGHGSRQCVAINLAWAELYLTTATVFRRLGRQIQLYDTSRERDVDMVHDFFVPAPSTKTRGVRVVAKQTSE
jgi:cytochrome P450